MSKYDKEREKLGLKPLGSASSSSVSTKSKYADEREQIRNGARVVQTKVSTPARSFNEPGRTSPIIGSFEAIQDYQEQHRVQPSQPSVQPDFLKPKAPLNAVDSLRQYEAEHHIQPAPKTEQPKKKSKGVAAAMASDLGELIDHATFGLTDPLTDRFENYITNENAATRVAPGQLDPKKQEIAKTISGLAGDLASGGAAYKVAKTAVAPLASRLPQLVERAAAPIASRLSPELSALTRIGVQAAGKTASAAATGAAAGALFQAPREATEAAYGTNDQTIGQRIGDVGVAAGLGMVGDPIIEAYGASLGTALKGLFKRNKIPGEQAQEILALPLGRADAARARSMNAPGAEPITNPYTFALPEPSITAPTTARVTKKANPYQQQFEALIDRAQQLQQEGKLTPGREEEDLASIWSQMAGREAPSLDELINLAYKPRPSRVTPNLATQARSYQSSRQAAGVPLPAKSLSDRMPRQGVISNADSPVTVPKGVRQEIEELIPKAAPEASTTAAPVESLVKQYTDADQVMKELDQRYSSPGAEMPVEDLQKYVEAMNTKSSLAERIQRFVETGSEDVQAMRRGATAVNSEAAAASVAAKPILPSTSTPAPRMKAEVIPFREPNPNAKVKPIALREIRKKAEKMFKIPIRTGRLGTADEDVLGVYKQQPEVVRTRNQGGIQEISHELGHHFDKKFSLQNETHRAELRNLIDSEGGIDTAAYTPQQLLAEGPAEFMRLYLTDPVKARQLAPKFFEHFETTVPEPELKKLAKLQEMVGRWIDQGEVMRFRGKITETKYEQNKSIAERAESAYGSMVDKLTHLATVEKEINKLAGGDKELADASVSAYKRARLTAGTPKKAQMIVNQIIKIFKPLEKAKIPLRDFRDYAVALHARDMEALGYESGFTQSEIEKTIKAYDNPVTKEVHAKIKEFQNNLLDMGRDEGELLSISGVEAMKNKFPNYMPMFRELDEDVSSGLISGKGFADLNSPIKKLKGSSRDIKDPIASIIRNVYLMVDNVEKNKVGLELARMAKVDGAGRWIERLSGAQSVRNENIITVWEKGEKVQYQLEPELYRTIKQMDEDVSNMVVRMLSVPTQLLRGGATLSPEFILRNPIKDQYSAYVVSEFGYNPIIDLPHGLFRVIKGKVWKNGDKLYEQWAKEGGGYGNLHSLDRNYIREQLKQLKKEGNPWARRTMAIADPRQWLRLLQAMSELTEEATKVGEFSRGIRKGATPEEAAFQSRDLMDFARIGNSIKQVNRIDAFLNANIQGKDRIARAFIKHPVRSTVRALKIVTVPTIGIYLFNKMVSNEKQKETLRESPQWLRDTFFLVSIPGTDVVARAPKPFDLAPLFSNLPENILRWIDEKDPQAWGEFTKDQVLQLINLPYMLTALAPIIENMTNYDFFTKGPVVPRRDQDAEPKNQYGNTTSSVAKEIGGALNYSPYKIDNLISGYTASLGRDATAGIDAILDKTGLSSRPPAAAKKFSEFPVINAFTVDNRGGGKSLDDFYKELDEARGKYDSFTNHQQGDKSIVPEYKALNRIAADISALNKKRRDAQASYVMTPKEKRNYLDELDEHIKDLARKGLEAAGKR